MYIYVYAVCMYVYMYVCMCIFWGSLLPSLIRIAEARVS